MVSDLRDILLRPLITEKSAQMMQDNKYTFKVALTANKIQIRQAVEEIFKVKVLAVTTMRVMGKIKKMGRHSGRRSDYKKAIVKLAPGQTIGFFEGL